ncbi:hypothetical protein FKW77_003948 [Venturia effusa]|uniref:Uncharacterized protein n=1 Tax=Venturia effusa TaxID=50376 RepID=A0A517L920_9PEZI|nr:hypothetical protein FKW77_003948 [Venturia effusa]
MACRALSSSVYDSLATTDLQSYDSGPKESTCDGKSFMTTKEMSVGHSEYDQIFDDFVHSENANDSRQSMESHQVLEPRIDEDVHRLTCVFMTELTAATPVSASGRLSLPPRPFGALGIRGAGCDREDLDHFSCVTTNCGCDNCNPPTPGEYVFTPISEDPMSAASNHASPSLMSTSTHSESSISILDLDSPTLGWTSGLFDLETSSSHLTLDPIFTHFNTGGLPSPDETPTEEDGCLTSMFPLFEARHESLTPMPTTPSAKRSQTDSCITGAPKKRSRWSDDSEVLATKRRKG